MGPGQGRAAAALARGLALGGAGDVRLPDQAALVRRRHADGQRALVRRRRRRPDRPADLLPFRPGHRRLRGPGGGGLGVRRARRLVGRQGPARVSRHPLLQARRLRLRLRPRRPGVVLPLRASEVDRPGDPPRGAGQDGPEDRRPRQGGLKRRLVAPPLRHQEQAAVRQVGHPGGIRLPLGGLPARAQAADHRRGAAAPPDLGRREGGPGRLPLLERGGRDRPLRVDVHRRVRRDRIARGTDVRQAGGNTARS